MMHNTRVEMLGKCRRLFYNKVNGQVLGITSGGGAIESLAGDDLIIATFNDHNAPGGFGCIEEYFNPIPEPGFTLKPIRVDLTTVQACHDAVHAHRTAKKAEADFVFEKGITLFGSEPPTTAALRHTLQVQEMHTRDDSGRVADHDAIIQAQTDLEALCKTCEDCCEQLLITRDAAITFAEPES